MRYLVLLFLVLCSCQSKWGCDVQVKELYPDSEIKVLDVPNVELTVYWFVQEDQYVTCNSAPAQLDVRSTKLVSWKEAHCRRTN
jgi:hypothetical protein